ncbi:hypothetical protein IT400_00775 [Candidatus Nomurabacteria bacterium]|nr:hypothetical protein [Candidatus Nomurabacteria bacterium]
MAEKVNQSHEPEIIKTQEPIAQPVVEEAKPAPEVTQPRLETIETKPEIDENKQDIFE